MKNVPNEKLFLENLAAPWNSRGISFSFLLFSETYYSLLPVWFYTHLPTQFNSTQLFIPVSFSPIPIPPLPGHGFACWKLKPLVCLADEATFLENSPHRDACPLGRIFFSTPGVIVYKIQSQLLFLYPRKCVHQTRTARAAERMLNSRRCLLKDHFCRFSELESLLRYLRSKVSVFSFK